MSTLSLRLPDSLHSKAKQVARKDHVSVNQFISMAVAEKVAAVQAMEELRKQAAKGNAAKFLAALDLTPDAPPLKGDELPEKAKKKKAA